MTPTPKPIKKQTNKKPNKKIKWLIYTVLVGLIPIASRLLVWFVTGRDAVNLFTASDCTSFGLVLHISNINEIEHIILSDTSWKTIQNGTSIVFIAFYSVLFALTLFGEIDESAIEVTTINYCTLLLAIISLITSYTVYHRISYWEARGMIK
ncbi:hypothetical protein [Spirulina sp. 06S082]|uniref:hypothetical protein n=1 Tax=Spirulina sp. 06S082 TaxID=3110248 RepID=UPI002B212EC3|nr:hypothetical protein [Spirulina sp. 06S082]MEA5471973.1 hypothetical protein [Spirulina sp. 06S082]